MKVACALLAAGSGSRFGGDKVLTTLGGKPLWRWSFDTFLSHPEVAEVGIVASATNLAAIAALAQEAAFVVAGGETRAESSRIAFESLSADADVLLIHDAARPFVSHGLISRVIEGIGLSGAAAPGVTPSDAVREESGGLRLLDRNGLRLMQTPQGATREWMKRAFDGSVADAQDEVALLLAAGVEPQVVQGEAVNLKVTRPEDLSLAQRLAERSETRTGFGYDIHAFSPDPSRPLWLGCSRFEGERGLEGHSDADVLAHAIVDALLGAVGCGDIGTHFPNSDPEWRNAPSRDFLAFASRTVKDLGWAISNIDATVIAESPRLGERRNEMRENLATALGIEAGRLSVKATTAEGLGALGRREGIAAHAVATLVRTHKE
ncbi:MAG: 2-C-methyl-D-erythritol 2,4-cyclodiphosphate synthase [Fimbriimonadaceae bacterium]|nr:MAG: 2-C-methyl-D-erythritol 2,4-cyclodiphosphate synthase [Fimbriimonadaceae bacterium]